jgi:hypothetical protein
MILIVILIGGFVWLLTDLIRGKGVFLLPESVTAIMLMLFDYFARGAPDGLIATVFISILILFTAGGSIRFFYKSLV